MLRSGSLLLLMSGLGLCLDLENIQRSSHFPGGASPQQGQQHHYGASKRTSVPRRDPQELHGRALVAPSRSSSSPEERYYYRLLSSRMARLLPALLGEQQQQYAREAPVVGASLFDDDSRDAGRAASHVAGEDATGEKEQKEQGGEQEADQVMMYLPKRRVVHSTAGSPKRRMQEPAEMNPSAYGGIRKRVTSLFKRRLHAVKDEKRKRSTRRQLQDAPFRRKPITKPFGKKQAPSLKDTSSMTSTSFRSGQQGSGKGSPVPVVGGNATVRNSDAKIGSKTSSARRGSGGNQKYHIMKRSSYSTDGKVTGELQDIFKEEGDDPKKHEQKTLKKRENAVAALKGPSGADDASSAVTVGSDGAAAASKGGAGSEEDKFKKWLLDEYYRTMALSFASMRRKRMATHQDTLDLHQVKNTALAPSSPVTGTADNQFQVVEDKLRSIEDTMIGEAVALVRDGASDDAELRAINAGVASRLDAAYDLESVRQSLDHLQSTLEGMRRQELQAALVEDEEEGDSASVLRSDGTDVQELTEASSWAQLTDKQACPAVQMLSSSCPAVMQSGSLVPAMQRLLLDTCEWQQTCYACGPYYGLGAEDCEAGAGDGHGASARFTQLLISQLLMRRTKNVETEAACSESCVAGFLLSH